MSSDWSFDEKAFQAQRFDNFIDYMPLCGFLQVISGVILNYHSQHDQRDGWALGNMIIPLGCSVFFMLNMFDWKTFRYSRPKGMHEYFQLPMYAMPLVRTVIILCRFKFDDRPMTYAECMLRMVGPFILTLFIRAPAKLAIITRLPLFLVVSMQFLHNRDTEGIDFWKTAAGLWMWLAAFSYMLEGMERKMYKEQQYRSEVLLGSVSHEMRTPIHVLSSNISYLIESDLFGSFKQPAEGRGSQVTIMRTKTQVALKDALHAR